MAAWAALSTEEQEAIIGRTKIDNIEIDDDDEPRKSHKTLATIDDGDGGELAILRDNMPFGRPGAGEFGTYFIGYSGRLWVIERMLERMFVGVPPGSYDRLLDFSTAITGHDVLRRRPRACSTSWPSRRRTRPPTRAPATGSLGIGSLRGLELDDRQVRGNCAPRRAIRSSHPRDRNDPNQEGNSVMKTHTQTRRRTWLALPTAAVAAALFVTPVARGDADRRRRPRRRRRRCSPRP